MIIDDALRCVRFLVIKPNGLIDWGQADGAFSDDGIHRSEDEVFDDRRLPREADGKTIIRLCNHDSCPTPDAYVLHLEPDGSGGVKFKNGTPAKIRNLMHLWNESTMKRAFVTVADERRMDEEGNPWRTVVRIERADYEDDELEKDWVVNKGGQLEKRPRK